MTGASQGLQKALARAGSSVVAIAEMQTADLLAELTDDQKAALSASLAPPPPAPPSTTANAGDAPAKGGKNDDDDDGEAPAQAAAVAAQARVKAVAKAVETLDACKGKAALALSMLADDDFANLSAGALVKLIGHSGHSAADASAEEAARSEMRAAIDETNNSDVDAAGGGNPNKPDKAKAASEAWRQVYADLDPKR